jgi:enamine deaminase RidA (YjgF/YER057c/UK114 family)
MKRQNVSSGGKWEAVVGYSRAVRVGDFVFVAGTTAADPNGVATGNAYEQTVKIFEIIRRALETAGASLEDVVRTRMFVKDISDSDEIGRAHGEIFGRIRPVATMVEVSRFVAPDMLVEIEVDAVVTGNTASLE